MSWTESCHADAETLADRLAQQLEALVRAALVARGRAVLALAGGRTPFPIYRRLAQARLDWSRVTLVATDERWVPATHAARNSREIREAFAAAAGVHILDLVPPSPGPVAEADTAEAALSASSDAFDAVLLGMGGDGHFASLFPGAVELAVGLDPCNTRAALRVNPLPLPPEAPFARISLTLSRLMHTRRLLVVATGDAKRAVLQTAQAQAGARAEPRTQPQAQAPARARTEAGPDIGTAHAAPSLPIAVLLRRATVPTEIHWSP